MDQKTLQDLCGNITERTAVITDWKSNHETICENQIELEKYMGECGNKQDDCDSSNILFTICFCVLVGCIRTIIDKSGAGGGQYAGFEIQSNISVCEAMSQFHKLS